MTGTCTRTIVSRILLACAVAGLSFSSFADSPDPFTHLRDTVTASKIAIIALDETARENWVEVPEGETHHAFQGDIVIENDRITVVLRKEGVGAEIYTKSTAGWAKQAVLHPALSHGESRFMRGDVLKNARDGIVLEALLQSPDGSRSGLQLELLLGQPFVKIQAVGPVEALRVEAPSAFVVLPDFFADDIVIAATDLPEGTAELPSENFLLNMTNKGDAIVLNVWDNREQDVRVVSGKGDGSLSIRGTEISFGEKGSIWVSVLAEKNVWHTRDISLSQKNQILPLEWRQPYPAVWRVDWRRPDRLTDSWEMAVENPDGTFAKGEIFAVSQDDWTDSDWWNKENPRRRWNTGLGGYNYPCWLDKEGHGFLQPLKSGLEFEGPAVIYPISRSAETPLDKFSVADIVRATLGVGPCQYILDVEGQDMDFKGLPTCATRDLLNDIYERGDHLNRSREIYQALDDVLAFIRLIRGRIEHYADFGREMEIYLAQEHEKSGAPKAFIEEMQAMNGKLADAIEERSLGIKTPEYAERLVNQFREDVATYTGADAEMKCKNLTENFVHIGENQDELVAECRLAVRLLRQNAALGLTQHPEAADIVNEIRKRTQAILRAPVNYEAARH